MNLYQAIKTAIQGSHAPPSLCLILAALVLVSSCASTQPQQPGSSQNAVKKIRVGDIFETATGKSITMDQLVDALSRAAIVFLGETHTSVEDHKVQLTLLQRLSRHGGCVKLAMEMFPAESQPALDSYLEGKISEGEFLKEVKWESVWGFPYQLYRDLIDWQKEKRMPVIGINAPNEIVRKIAHNGLESLTPEERSKVAREFHLDDPANRARLQKEFAVHTKGKIKGFESFFAAQLAWEETMGQNLSQLLQDSKGCAIVVVIGKGHIDERLGVPYFTYLRTPRKFKTVAPISINYPFYAVDPDIADYVVITN